MSYGYITGKELANLLKGGAKVAVVDVRDDDFRGGNIVGAIHAPSEERTTQSTQDLVKKLEGVPKVVLHCALSQSRGPKAARVYAEELRRQAKDQATGNADLADHGVDNGFSPNPYSPKPEQEVLVLRGGFTEFQGIYRNDPELVEKFDERVWGRGGQNAFDERVWGKR